MVLEATPPQYSSVNDALVYVAYDAHATDPVTYPNYAYIGEVFFGATMIQRARVFPDPTTKRGEFDFSTIIRNYVIAKLQPEMGQGVFAIDIVVKLREEYSGTIGGILVTDSTRTFFNHYNGRIDSFTNLDLYANKAATSRPKTIELVSTTGLYYLPYFATSTTPFNVIINGVTTTITPTVANTIQNINIAINTTNDYNVVLAGETFNVKVICEPLNTPYVIHFLSQFGGFESMSFHKVSKKKFNIDKKTWQQPKYRVSNAGAVSLKTSNVMHQQVTTYGVTYKEKLTLNTDLLSDAEYEWLFQLMVSPIVYLQEGSTLYPVTITASDYDEKQYLVDGLTNLTIEVDFGTNYKTQFQ